MLGAPPRGPLSPALIVHDDPCDTHELSRFFATVASLQDLRLRTVSIDLRLPGRWKQDTEQDTDTDRELTWYWQLHYHYAKVQARRLAEALRVHAPSLRHLHLDNVYLGSTAARTLARVLANSQLRLEALSLGTHVRGLLTEGSDEEFFLAVESQTALVHLQTPWHAWGPWKRALALSCFPLLHTLYITGATGFIYDALLLAERAWWWACRTYATWRRSKFRIATWTRRTWHASSPCCAP